MARFSTEGINPEIVEIALEYLNSAGSPQELRNTNHMGFPPNDYRLDAETASLLFEFRENNGGHFDSFEIIESFEFFKVSDFHALMEAVAFSLGLPYPDEEIPNEEVPTSPPLNENPSSEEENPEEPINNPDAIDIQTLPSPLTWEEAFIGEGEPIVPAENTLAQFLERDAILEIQLSDTRKKERVSNTQIKFTFGEIKEKEEDNYSLLTTTNTNGESSINYFFPKGIKKGDSINLQIEILDDNHQVLDLQTHTISAGQLEPLEISFQAPKLSKRKEVLIKKIFKFAKPDPELIKLVNSKKWKTVGEIARAGGLQNHKDFEKINPSDKQLIDAHVNLSLISDRTAMNHKLITNGFSSLSKIAKKTKDDFIQKNKKLGDEEILLQIHQAAVQANMGINNVVLQQQGKGNPPSDSMEKSGAPNAEGKFLGIPTKPSCDCPDCQTAVSPIAYLSDLLDYAVNHLEYNGDPIDIGFLEENLLHQPIRQIPLNCHTADEMICQKRIVAEVLQQYYKDDPLAQYIPETKPAYLQMAYFILLDKLGTSFQELRAARTDTANVQQRLADRIGVSLTRLFDLFIDVKDPSQLTESKLETLFGYRDTTRDPISPTPKSQFIDWRTEFLEDKWALQDKMDDIFSRKEHPFIDPNIIGPDDFRIVDASVPEYKIWERRRREIDLLFGAGLTQVLINNGNLAGIFASFYSSFWSTTVSSPAAGYTPVNTAVSDFPTLANNLKTNQNKTNTIYSIWENLHLKPDAFLRLYSLSQEPDLPFEVIEEILSIATLAYCNSKKEDWIAEEANLRFDYNVFWFSLTEPKVGTHTPVSNLNYPFIDPELINRSDLPDYEYGGDSVEKYERRKIELQQLLATLQTTRETNITPTDNGFDTLWNAIYAGSSLPHFSNLFADLNNGVAGVENLLKEEGHLEVADFLRLMEIHHALNQTDAPWEDAYLILLQPAKINLLYPTWKSNENKPIYQLIKLPLSPWNAPISNRIKWQQALENRLKLPIITPYLVHPTDLNGSIVVDNIYNNRLNQIQSEWTNIQGQWGTNPSQNQLQSIIEDYLGDIANQLSELSIRRNAGEDIRPELTQFNLAPTEFDFILSIKQLNQNNQPILQEEKDDFLALLLRVHFERGFAAWHIEENDADIALSPKHFKLARKKPLQFPPPKPTPLEKFFGEAQDRRRWQKKLEGRYDQIEGAKQLLQDAIEAAEEEAFTLLNRSLVYLKAPGQLIDISKDQGEMLIDRLSIDVKNECCNRVTRVSQLIESLQILLMNLRQGLLDGMDFKPTLNAPYFDEEWIWIGSYGNWRSAMFVFLYPENILIPNLRKNYTQGFKDVKKAMQSGRRFSPAYADLVADEYMAWHEDILHLEVKATIHLYEENEINQNHQFAQSSLSNKLYWRFTNEGVVTAYWHAIPYLEKETVVDIIGASCYTDKYIYLFLKLENKGKLQLAYLTYNLEKGSWEDNLVELPTPKESRDFNGVVRQYNDQNSIPQLAIQLESGAIYLKWLSLDGKTWHDENWIMSIPSSIGKTVKIKSLVATAFSLNSVLIMDVISSGFKPAGSVIYRFFGNMDDGKIRVLGSGVSNQTYTTLGTSLIEQNNGFYWFFRFSNNSYTQQRYAKVTFQTSGYLTNYTTAGIYVITIWVRDNWHQRMEHLPFDPSILEVYKTVLSHLYNLVFDNNLYDAIQVARYLYDEILQTTNQNEDQVWAILKPLLDEIFRMIRDNNFSEDENINLDWIGAKNMLLEIHDIDLVQIVTLFIKNENPQVDMKHRPNDQSFNSQILSNDVAYVTPNAGKMVFGSHTPFTYATYKNSVNQNCGKSKLEAASNVNFNIVAHEILNPSHLTSINIKPKDMSYAARRMHYDALFYNNFDISQPNWVLYQHIREVTYFVPIQIALQLQKDGYYQEALDWFRTVYDYSLEVNKRKIDPWLKLEESSSLHAFNFNRNEDWMQDPLSPHSIAVLREDTYTRFTLLAIARCFIAYADAEFTRDTAETIPRAREHYRMAEDLLDLLGKHDYPCDNMLGELEVIIGDEYLAQIWEELSGGLIALDNPKLIEEGVDGLNKIGKSNDDLSKKIQKALTLMNELNEKALDEKPLLFETMLEDREEGMMNVQSAMGYQIPMTGETLVNPSAPLPVSPAYTQMPSGQFITVLLSAPIVKFCVPVNPAIQSMRLKAALNLFKIRHCMNIAGVYREVEPYAAPTDSSSGMPMIGAGGNLNLPSFTQALPTQYRFRFLIEQTKNLVGLAQQIESAYLSTLEKRDSEAYHVLQAEQHLDIAKSSIKLQNMRVKEAQGHVVLAELQANKSQLMVDGYSDFIDAGLNAYELKALQLMRKAMTLQSVAAGLNVAAAASYAIAAIAHGISAAKMIDFGAAGFSYVGQGLGSAAGAVSTFAGVSSTHAGIQNALASYARREQEWTFQKSMAEQDVIIGAQQIRQAEMHVQVVGQEYEIAQMEADQAKETIDFLKNKFTNVELYDWMSGVLGNVYGYFLQISTGTAQQAANQLAFERQETVPPFIQSDYWDAPSDASNFSGEEVKDRRGITGSTRLLQDIHKLDQFAINTDKRKLQLTKTISLAQLDPIAFETFRATGKLSFSTPMELFDHDFPGQYLRLVRQVKTSVLALVPPTAGIKATLQHSGLSRVVIGGDIFQEKIIRQTPEMVALSAAQETNGLFDMQQSNHFLNPFEGAGVATSWEFTLEKAANLFDYSTIADVLFTIEYTAMHDFNYEQQVIARLGSEMNAIRMYSLKSDFPDQWFDLHNPDQTINPMEISLDTSETDYPPHLSDIIISGSGGVSGVKLLVITKDQSISLDPITLNFSPIDNPGNLLGGTQGTADQIYQWGDMNGFTVGGSWQIDFGDDPITKARFRQLFTDEEIIDILLVIKYEGLLPTRSRQISF